MARVVDPVNLPEIRRSAAAAGAGLDELRDLAAGCQGCDLYADSRATMFDRLVSDLRLVA